MSSLSVTLIQTQLFWEDKPANLAMLKDKIINLAPTEVVVLPEMFSTGFSMQPQKFAESMNGPTITWMRDLAALKKIIITGSIIIEEEGRYFNRLIWMLPTGNYGYYDKRHLFAYAGEDEVYSRGHKRLITSVKGFRIQMQICYDLRFPVWVRQQVDETPEYDAIIYVANWPDRRITAWNSLLQARAIENQCYVIGVNRTGNDGNNIYHSGYSTIIDPVGNIIYQKADEEDIFSYQIQKETITSIRDKFPFWKDGDHFIMNLI